MIVEERKNGLGKGGKYLQKENILFYGGKEKLRGKMRKIFEEGKYFSVEEKEKEGNIWRRSLKDIEKSHFRFRFRYWFWRIWSRKKSLSFGFGEFGLGKKVSVSVSENLVSEKKSR